MAGSIKGAIAVHRKKEGGGGEQQNKRVKDRAKNLERKEKQTVSKSMIVGMQQECDSGHAPIDYSLLSL